MSSSRATTYCLNRNAQEGGEHEVHRLNTPYSCLPAPENRIDLGWHINCQSAIAEARRRYPYWIIDGCGICIPECHTR
jgi:hypothetical protein